MPGERKPRSETQEPATLTVETLKAAWDHVAARGREPHVHMVHPNGGYCMCGMRFTREDIERSRRGD